VDMENLYDYKKFAILYVDDEEKSLKYFTRAFADQFRIFTAANAQDGFKLFEQHADEIGLLLTDQRMPGEKGVWLLGRARQLRPHVLRMLVTPTRTWRPPSRRQQRRDLQIRHQNRGTRRNSSSRSSRAWNFSWCRPNATSCSAKKCPCCAT